MSSSIAERRQDPTPDGEGWRTVRTADGHGVAYAEFGSPGGTPVLFFHGTPGSRLLGGVYDGPARERGVRVLAVDRPGFGRSDPWPERRPADVGDYVAPVLDDAGVATAGVVGFSGGAIDALGLAETRPDLVEDVALVSGAVPASLGDPPRLLSVLSALAGTTPSLLKGIYRCQAWAAGRASPSFVCSQFTTGDCPEEVPDDVAELVRRDFVEAFARTASGAVTESRLFIGEWGVTLDAVDQAVRLHHGEMDTNVPVEGARRLASNLPNGTVREYETDDHLTTLLASRSAVLDRFGDR